MNDMNQCISMKHLAVVSCVGLLLCLVTGCGTVQHSLTLTPGYQLKADTRVEVGEVSNETGQSFDVDVVKLLSDALTEELRRTDLLWSGGESYHIKVTSQIVDYKKGNAFKRWLLPGWGSTVLIVHCDLLDGGRIVGSAEAKRTVSVGGGYTIGAWHTIFAGVAKDVVADLRKQIPH